MKLPKTFRPNKDLEKKTEDLINFHFPEYSKKRVERLVNTSELFLEEQKKIGLYFKSIEQRYNIANDLVKNMLYTNLDLEGFIKSLPIDNKCEPLGIYISALINKLIEEDDIIILDANNEFLGLGSYLERGTLMVKGDIGHETGYSMKGGKIIVKGSVKDMPGFNMLDGKIIINGYAGRWVGNCMEGGEILIGRDVENRVGNEMRGGQIIVNGNAGNDTGNGMKKGTIIIKGSAGEHTGLSSEKDAVIKIYGGITSINYNSCKGTIYQRDKKIWPK